MSTTCRIEGFEIGTKLRVSVEDVSGKKKQSSDLGVILRLVHIALYHLWTKNKLREGELIKIFAWHPSKQVPDMAQVSSSEGTRCQASSNAIPTPPKAVRSGSSWGTQNSLIGPNSYQIKSISCFLKHAMQIMESLRCFFRNSLGHFALFPWHVFAQFVVFCASSPIQVMAIWAACRPWNTSPQLQREQIKKSSIQPMVVTHLNIRIVLGMECSWDWFFVYWKNHFIILLASRAACGPPEHLESWCQLNWCQHHHPPERPTAKHPARKREAK